MTTTLIDGLKERISTAMNINYSVGIILHGNNYGDIIQALMEQITSRTGDDWVYIAITRPYDTIIQQYDYIKDKANIKFVDCVSRAAGITTTYPNCKYIESPVALEKIMLDAISTFRNTPENRGKYLIIDSLSSLLIYNEGQMVTEFLTHLTNRARLSDIHCVYLMIEEETDETINKMIYLRSDKIIRLKESFL
jgi:archaellum biogenesis ATPase FlaH